MQLVVLAGGFGTRLRGAISEGIPKPMAPIAGRPFLERLLDRAIDQGVEEIILLVGYLADVIASHFGNSYREVPVAYNFESVPLGTGGALKAAATQLAERFLFVNGDTFANVDYRDLIKLLSSSPLAMSLAYSEDVSRYGSVLTAGDLVVGFNEKGSEGRGMVNVGAYACHRDILDLLPDRPDFSFEVDFLEPELPRLRPRFQLADSGIIDIGTPESFAFANAVFGQYESGVQ